MDSTGQAGAVIVKNLWQGGLSRICFMLLSVQVAAQPVHTAELPSVVSINLCADQLVLALADEQQITALSLLSHEPAGSYYYSRALNFAVNSGKAGEVILHQPDLVIAGQYSDFYTVRALRSAGLRVELLPIANSLESMFSNLEQVADWLGQSARGEALVLSLRQRLIELPEPTGHKVTAAVYDPNGYTVGDQSLRGDVLQRAGWHNVALDAGIRNYGVLALETLMRLQPDVLIESPYSPGTFSRAQQLNQHPALTQSGLAPGIISVPSAQTICGGPWTVDLIERLSSERAGYQDASPVN